MAIRNHEDGPASAGIFAAYAPAMRRYFRGRVHGDEIEDLVQEVFLAMHARRQSSPVLNVEAYLFTIARHVLYRHTHRQTTRESSLSHDYFEEISDETPNQDRWLTGHQELHAVLKKIEALPERTRRVFIMHRFEELSYPAIGRHLGVSVSAVEKHIMTALRLLLRQREQDK